jgi:hypothetical protein
MKPFNSSANIKGDGFFMEMTSFFAEILPGAISPLRLEWPGRTGNLKAFRDRAASLGGDSPGVSPPTEPAGGG